MEQKEIWGCISPTDNYQWKIEPCFLCNGYNEKCEECNGSNVVIINRCPRSIITDDVYSLLPYFYDYYGGLYHGNQIWPDGRSRMYQPIKLIKAFNILLSEKDRIEKKKEEEKKKDAKS